MSDDDVILVEDHPPRKSISCEQIPELFLDKLIAKKHFSQYGKIYRFILRPKRLSCTVEYETEKAAEAAHAHGGVFKDIKFNVFWTDEVSKSAAARDEAFVDPEVQQELESMSGGPASIRVKQQQHHSSKQSIESFLKKTERFPTLPVVAPPKPQRASVKQDGTGNTKITQALAEFEALARKPANSAEERYRVLEARDKYIRQTTDRTTDIRKAKSTQGVCEDMCPEKERYMRECKFQVASYEAGDTLQQISHHKAIKQYSRSSADQEAPLPNELRTEKALGLAMAYLLHNIVDRCEDEDVNLSDWFHYVWDRTRGIRKDITQQELCSPKAVQLVEQCARFHIHCAARLVAEDPSVFDQKINTENMTKCLQSLKYMYHDLGLKGIRCENEAEFRGYIVLLNLNDGNFLWEVKQLAPEILHSSEIQFALQVYFALENNNYVRFFRLVRGTTYMNACILLRYFNQVRTQALETILKAYTYRIPASFSLYHLTELLAFEDVEPAASFFEFFGLPVDLKLEQVVMDPKQYERPEIPYRLERALNLVESKRVASIGQAIAHEPLGYKYILSNHRVENSFDMSGYFKEDLLAAILKQGKLADQSSTQSDDNLFKVPSPTSISPKPVFPKPLAPTNLFQPSRFTSKIEATTVVPVAPSIFSKSSPSPILAGITPLRSATTEESPKASSSSGVVGANLFGSVAFTTPRQDASCTSSSSIFSSFAPKSSRTEVRSITEPPSSVAAAAAVEREQVARRQALDRELRQKLQREEELQQKQQQEAELRKLREAEEERMRQELIARKAAEIRRLKEQEAEIKRQRETLLVSISERVFAELTEELCKADLPDIVELCYNQYALYPQSVLKEISEELLKELAEEACREEMLIRNCQESRQMNLMRKYFGIWRKHVCTMIDNRQQIENSPAWLPERRLGDQARLCYHPHQDQSLGDMKRYLAGMPKDFALADKPKEQIDIFTIIPSCRQIASGREALLKNHVYWKVGVSIPYKQEEDAAGFYYFINKWLKDLFKRSSNSDGKYFFLEAQESVVARERNAVCLRLIKGVTLLDELNTRDPKAIDNSDGVIFFLNSNNIRVTRQRLHTLLQSADVWGPVALAIIAYNYRPDANGSIEELLNLDLLLEENKVSDFKVYQHHEVEPAAPLRKIVHSSLAFLASNYNAECPLEMQTQTAFIGTCVGDELWHRLRLSAAQNSKLHEACQDINFVIQLYNQALDRVCNIVQHDFSQYPDFPAEFKPFVSKRRFDIPLDLEYFPRDWQSSERQSKLVQFFTQLKLKPAAFDTAQCDSLKKLQSHFHSYLRSVLPKQDEKLARRILALVTHDILKALPTDVPFQQSIMKLSWLSPLAILSSELLRLCWGMELARLPCEVIYHKQEFESYTRTLWWLPEIKKLFKRKSETMEGATKQQPPDASGSEEEDTENDPPGGVPAAIDEPLRKRTRYNISLAKEDLEAILARGAQCLERAEAKLDECRRFAANTKDLSSALDGQLYQQERAFRASRWAWEANFR